MTGLARYPWYMNSLWKRSSLAWTWYLSSSAERIIAPDTTILIDYMLNRFETSLERRSSLKTWSATWTLHLVWFSANVLCWLWLKRHDPWANLRLGATRSSSNHGINSRLFRNHFLNRIQKWHHASLKKKSTKSSTLFYYTKRVDKIFERISLGD